MVEHSGYITGFSIVVSAFINKNEIRTFSEVSNFTNQTTLYLNKLKHKTIGQSIVKHCR